MSNRKGLFFLRLVFVSCALVLGFDLSGCAGGSRGTGQIRVEGRVLSIGGIPVPGVIVSDLSTGSSDVTDGTGTYVVQSELVGTVIQLGVDAENFSDTVELMDLSPRTRAVQVDLVVSEEDQMIVPGELIVFEDDDQDSSDSGSSESEGSGSDDDGNDDSQSGSTGSSGSHKDDDDSDPQGTPTPILSEPPVASETPEPSATPEAQEIETEGVLSSLNGSLLTVSGVTYQLTGSTSFRDSEGHTISLSSFSVGDEVKAEGIVSNGQAIATTVTLRESGESEGSSEGESEGSSEGGEEEGSGGGSHQSGEDVEAEGAIQALSSTSITVDGTTFTLTASTVYRDEHGSTVSLSYFQVNDSVHVEGVEQGGENIALTVRETD